MALKQKTVYFREDDLEKWDKITNKAEWLHKHLNGSLVTYAQKGKTVTIKVPGFKEPTVTPPEETL